MLLKSNTFFTNKLKDVKNPKKTAFGSETLAEINKQKTRRSILTNFITFLEREVAPKERIVDGATEVYYEVFETYKGKLASVLWVKKPASGKPYGMIDIPDLAFSCFEYEINGVYDLKNATNEKEILSFIKNFKE